MKLLLCLLLLLTINPAEAQTDSVYHGRPDTAKVIKKKKLSDRDWFNRITWGGNFQAWFGNPSFVFLSPTIGYTPVNNLNLGVGFIYNYLSVDGGGYGRFRQSVFGGHTYVRYVIAKNYFVQAQFDRLRQPDYFAITPGEKIWVNYLLGGGGFRHLLGEKAAILTSLMYNFTPNPLSIYPSRIIIQFGIVAGL